MTTQSNPTTESTTTSGVPCGRFVWYDLITTNVPAATAFYTSVAGWGTQDFDMGPGGKYQMWTVAGVPVGGVVQLTPAMGAPGTPPHWMAHVSVPNVDESAAQVVSLGGKVLSPPSDIPTVGRYAVVADPQGAAINLFTPLQGSAPQAFAPKVGEFSWHELATSDHRAAFSFYSKVLAWENQGSNDMGPPMGEYLMFGQGGDPARPAPYGGMFTMSPDMRMPPGWVYYIRVASADETVATIKSLGGQVLHGPVDVPGGDRIAQCMDPQGAMFAVHSVKDG